MVTQIFFIIPLESTSNETKFYNAKIITCNVIIQIWLNVISKTRWDHCFTEILTRLHDVNTSLKDENSINLLIWHHTENNEIPSLPLLHIPASQNTQKSFLHVYACAHACSRTCALPDMVLQPFGDSISILGWEKLSIF